MVLTSAVGHSPGFQSWSAQIAGSVSVIQVTSYCTIATWDASSATPTCFHPACCPPGVALGPVLPQPPCCHLATWHANNARSSSSGRWMRRSWSTSTGPCLEPDGGKPAAWIARPPVSASVPHRVHSHYMAHHAAEARCSKRLNWRMRHWGALPQPKRNLTGPRTS